MTEETLDATILTLRAKALETFGLMKDIYARDAQIGDVDLLAQYSMKLAQFEGAMITLQQYKENIIESAKERRAAQQEQEAKEQPPEPDTITEKELSERSDSYKRSIAFSAPPVRTSEVDES